MAVFGAPVALEDHAIRACLGAHDMQAETRLLADEVQRRDGIDLLLRVGLNSGQVVAGEIGSGIPGYTAIGEQVGLAQRMESVAPPGGVTASEIPFHVVTRLLRAGIGVTHLDGAAARARVRERVPDADPQDLLLLDDLLGCADPDVPLPAIDPDAGGGD
jgi:adenylate cyclase